MNKERTAQVITFIFFISYFFLIVSIFGDYGITWDEYVNDTYGNHILNYYLTIFQDKTAYSYWNMYFFGGLFDTWCAVIYRTFSLPVYETRHFLNGMMGLLGAYYAYRISYTIIASRYFALLAAIFLFFCPRYFGHSFNNHKDIPFAVLYLASLCYICETIKYWAQERIPLWHLLKIGLASGLCMGVRVGGLLLLCYWVLFFSLYQINLVLQKLISYRQAWWRVLRTIFLPIVLAYGTMLIFWPWAQQNPLTYPLHALRHVSHFPYSFPQLFAGQEMTSDSLPWYYILTWFYIATPPILLVGICPSAWCYLGCLRKKEEKRKTEKWAMSLLIFAVIFPLLYMIYQKSTLYNGLRHFLFVLPLVCVLATIGFHHVYNVALPFMRSRIQYLLFHAVFICCLTINLVFIGHWYYRSHPHQFVYFNKLIGGLPGAYRNYEIDYWGNSHKKAAEWLNEYAQTRPGHGRKLVVKSYAHPLSLYYYLDPKFFSCHLELISDPLGWRHMQADVDWDFFVISRELYAVTSSYIRTNGGTAGVESKRICVDSVPLVVIYRRITKE